MKFALALTAATAFAAEDQCSPTNQCVDQWEDLIGCNGFQWGNDSCQPEEGYYFLYNGCDQLWVSSVDYWSFSDTCEGLLDSYREIYGAEEEVCSSTNKCVDFWEEDTGLDCFDDIQWGYNTCNPDYDGYYFQRGCDSWWVWDHEIDSWANQCVGLWESYTKIFCVASDWIWEECSGMWYQTDCSGICGQWYYDFTTGSKFWVSCHEWNQWESCRNYGDYYYNPLGENLCEQFKYQWSIGCFTYRLQASGWRY